MSSLLGNRALCWNYSGGSAAVINGPWGVHTDVIWWPSRVMDIELNAGGEREGFAVSAKATFPSSSKQKQPLGKCNKCT